MTFFRLLVFAFSMLFVLGCDSAFDKDAGKEASTFSVGKVELVRVENSEFDTTTNMPTEQIYEVKAEILDKGLEVAIANEEFFVETADNTVVVTSDFAGQLYWTIKTKVSPDNPAEKLTLTSKVSANGRHRGSESVPLVIRPWLNSDAQMVDLRYQNVEDNSETLFADSGVRLDVGEIEVAYQKQSFSLSTNLNLSMKREYQLTLDPQLFRSATGSQSSYHDQIAEGEFELEIALIDSSDVGSSPEAVSEWASGCSPDCVISKAIYPVKMDAGKIDVIWHLNLLFKDLPRLRYRQLLLVRLKSVGSQLVKPYSGFLLWNPMQELSKLELRSLPSWTELVEPLEPVETLLSAEQQKQELMEVLGAKPMPQKWIERLRLNEPDVFQNYWNGDERDMIEKASDICNEYVKEHEEDPRGFWQWTFDGFSKYEPTGCRTFADATLEMHRVFVNRNLKSYQQLPSMLSRRIIEVQAVVFAEVRSDSSVTYGQEDFNNKFAEAKAEFGAKIPFTEIGATGAAVMQGGQKDFRVYSASEAQNQRSRNTLLDIDQIFSESIDFRLEMAGFHCLTFRPPDEEQQYLHCHTEDQVEKTVEESWYYLYGKLAPSNQVFLVDPKDSGQGQWSLTLQGKRNHTLFQRLLEDEARTFDFVFDMDNQTRKDFAGGVENAIQTEAPKLEFPGVIFY